jgi:branched-chain amino acid aminotransferase
VSAPGRRVWLDGRLVPVEEAALAIDDPAVRFGEGLFETMRADGGRVPWLERHLDRLERSAAALGLAPMPERDAVREGVERALAAAAAPSARVRVTLSPRPTLLVEVTPEPAHPPLAPEARAIAIHGAWLPGHRLAEHKTLSYGAYRRAQALAAAAGVEHALLLDGAGRLGEAAVGNAFAVLHGAVVSAPVQGLLPGVARGIVLELAPVREEALEEPVWRAADELFLTNAVAGVIPVVAVDGRPIGAGRPGPVTRDLADAVRARAG